MLEEMKAPITALKEKLKDKRLHLSKLMQENTADNPYLKLVKALENEVMELREQISA